MSNQKEPAEKLIGWVDDPWKNDAGELSAIPFNLKMHQLKEILDNYCVNSDNPDKAKASFTMFHSKKTDKWYLRVYDPNSPAAVEKRKEKQRDYNKSQSVKTNSSQSVSQADDDIPF